MGSFILNVRKILITSEMNEPYIKILSSKIAFASPDVKNDQ